MDAHFPSVSLLLLSNAVATPCDPVDIRIRMILHLYTLRFRRERWLGGEKGGKRMGEERYDFGGVEDGLVTGNVLSPTPRKRKTYTCLESVIQDQDNDTWCRWFCHQLT
jgi:hypothetical protein